jgi:serine/threonine-protein kinase HipA
MAKLACPKNPDEETALILKRKKSNLKSADFIDYYAKERLQLNEKTITIILEQMKKAIPVWKELLEISFLSDEMKIKYLKLLETRIVMFG